MNVFDVAIRFKTEGQDSVVTAINNLESKSSGIGSKLGAGLKTAAKIGAAAIGAASAAITAFGVSSVKAGMAFDASMSQVAATMGVTTDQIGELRDFAQEMGRTTKFSATEAADALNYMALAGYDAATSMNMLPNVLNLAAAGNMDLAKASDMVTDTQTAFGITLERTSQMVDEMAKAASTGNTSVEQLGEAFLTVGGLAKNLNGGLVTLKNGTTRSVDGVQELEIALTAMANAGIKGSEAGTHMRNMLLKLSSPTAEGVKQLDALGVSVFDAEGNMRSLKDVFGDLSEALSEATQEEKMQAMSNLFNARDMASSEALLSAISQDWDDIGAAILEAEGAASKMAKTQLDNLAGDVTIFKSALEGAKIAISDELSPTLREFVQLGTDGISQITEGFKTGGLQGAMEAFGEILSSLINKIVEEMPKFVEGGMRLLKAFGQGIMDNLDMIIDAAVEIVVMLAEGLMSAIPKLVKAAIKIIRGLAKGIADALPELVPAAVEMILEIVSALVENIPLIIAAAVQLITGLAEGLIQAIPVLIEYIPVIIEALIDGILGAIPLIIEAGIKLLTSLIAAIPEIIVAIVEHLPEIIDGIITGLMDNLPLIIQAGVELFVALISNTPKIILEIIKRLPEIIEGIVTGLIDNIGKIIQAGVDLMIGLAKGIASWAANIWEAAKNIGQQVLDAIGGFFSDIWQAGVDLVKGLWQGIKDTAQWIKDKIAGFVDDVMGWFKKLFGIKSPSKEMAKLGDMLDQGLAVGIERSLDDVLNAATDIHDGVNEALEGMGGSVDIDSSFDGLKAQKRTQETTAELTLANIATRLDNLENDMYSAVSAALRDGVDIQWDDRNLARLIKNYA